MGTGNSKVIAGIVAVAVVSVGAIAAPAGGIAAASGTVVVNELHFHPDDDDPASEFIELFNLDPGAVDLGGWCIDGIDYCFPAGSSVPGLGFLVVTGDRYDGALSNGGEEIVLFDADGTVVDELEYDDKDEWPALADGEGASLQRRDVAAPSGEPGNWEAHPPTPGTHNISAGVGLRPTFSDVEHTVSPAPGAAIEVTAELHDAASASLTYVVGFGAAVTIPMSLADGVVSATIPGQAAGALVRYRLTASRSGLSGTWPRQGDGSNYRGTVVQREIATGLPVFEFFMPDDVYDTMINDLTLSGDDGYPMVFAYDGQVFDNARVRVKGQTSRFFPKKKLKFIMPAGYDVEDDDLFPDDVDEFAMHSAWIDRSFIRETLASEFMVAADMRGAQQAFPVRLERNGTFYGLYSYVEQPDGTYRDRYDLDDSEVYEVGPDNIFGELLPADVTRPQDRLRARYDKETFEYLDDQRLRDFIATVNGLSGQAEADWIDGFVDIPSVVNALAASMVIQHQDWGVKNYRLVFDQYGRVNVLQNDYDLTFGRRWSNTLGPYDTSVYVGGAFEHPGGPFFFTFFADPELSAMVKRRVRTLTDELLNPAQLHPRIAELAALVRPEALADRAIWGTYGGSADPTDEAWRLRDQFAGPQYERLLGRFAPQGRIASAPQPAVPAVSIAGVSYLGDEHVVLRNDSGDTVDLSSFEIPEIDLTVPGGTVLLPGRTAIFLHEDIERTAGAFGSHLVAGYYDDPLAEATDGLTLLNRAGARVSAWDVVPPLTQTEFEGRADRSALVGLISVGSVEPGHLQVLPCGDDPGRTSNLNNDAAGQTRAALALTRFDADGTACVFNYRGTNIVADVQGYFVPDAIDDVDDVRLADTRSGAAPAARSVTRITGGRPDATGIVNLTATGTVGAGHVSVVPCDSTGQPTTSSLNWTLPNTTIATAAFVRFDGDGAMCVYAYESTDLVVDLLGYLSDGAFDDTDDERALDTRSGSRVTAGTSVQVTGRPDSTAVVSLTAVGPAAAGHLGVHDCSATPDATSNLNYDRAGLTIATLATVRFDGAGVACVYSHADVDVVVDVQGYFAGGAFDDIVDERVLDTRD